jgi:hypothetical protein
MARWGLAAVVLLGGCSARPLELPAPSSSSDVPDLGVGLAPSDLALSDQALRPHDLAHLPPCSDGGPPACVPLTPPRAIAPLSTATVTSQRPRLRWALSGVSNGALVEIYRDRAGSDLVTSFFASGKSGTPASPLARGVYYWRLRGALDGVAGGDRSVMWEFLVGAGSAATNTSWGTMLDINGDGFADTIIGTSVPNDYHLPAEVQVYLGSASGLGAMPTTLDGPSALDTTFGAAAASAGDVNGDGFGDVVVGAPSCCGVYPGAAYLFFGGPSGLSPQPVTLVSPKHESYYGWSVAGAGDVNGDGYADVVVLAPGAAAYLFLGGADGPRADPVAFGSLENTLASAGDVNGDGFGDVLVGNYWANNGAGQFSLFLGGANGLSASPITVASPTGGDGMFAQSLAGAGDINGDGLADIIVGAPGVIPVVYLYYGSPSGVAMTPTALPSQGGPTDTLTSPHATEFGAAVASAGDVNGDGFADVLVGSPEVIAAYLYFGSANGITSAARPTTLSANGIGGDVSGSGDVNGDGFSDVVLGSINYAYGYQSLLSVWPGGGGGPSALPTTQATPSRVWCVAGGTT